MRFKIFDCYFLVFDLSDHRVHVLSVKQNKERVLRPVSRSGSLYYSLYKNTVKKEYSLRELVNMVFLQMKV